MSTKDNAPQWLKQGVRFDIEREQAKQIADAVEQMLNGHVPSVTLMVYGFELVLHPEYKYYDDETKSIGGIAVFLNDTSGG